MKTTSIVGSCCIGLAVTIVSALPAAAYPTYSREKVQTYRTDGTDDEAEGEPSGNCTTCHGQFRATNEGNRRPYLRDMYLSLSDGQPWEEVYTEIEPGSEPADEIGLHEVHRHIMLDKIGRSRCDTCHIDSGRYPVPLAESAGGGGVLDPIGCVGCHGRAEDAGNDSVSAGYGAGLRQHHTNAGINECKSCHSDADPANYTPVSENISPPYYFTPDDVFTNKPTDSCNLRGGENYAGGRRGLDNDGDGKYDILDSDCRPPFGGVEICHPSGRGKDKTLTVNGALLLSHLAHGDSMGPCGAAQ